MVSQQHKSQAQRSPALSLSFSLTFSHFYHCASTSTAPNEPRNAARKVRLMFVVCGINFVYKSFVRTTLPPSSPALYARSIPILPFTVCCRHVSLINGFRRVSCLVCHIQFVVVVVVIVRVHKYLCCTLVFIRIDRQFKGEHSVGKRECKEDVLPPPNTKRT